MLLSGIVFDYNKISNNIMYFIVYFVIITIAIVLTTITYIKDGNNKRYNFSNKKVEFLLDELGKEYKSLLTEKILDKMRIFDVDNIDLSELIKLDIEVKKYLKVKEKDRTQKRLWSIVALLGVLYFMTGFLILTLDYVRSDMSPPLNKRNFYNIDFFRCSHLYIISIFFCFFNKQVKRSKNKDTSYYVLINKWKEIEALIIQLTPAEHQRGNNNMVEY